MFFHIYFYRIKCILRDKQMMFWTLMFPILLAVLFNMTLSNITSGETFREIKIAMVENEEFQSNSAFKTVLSSVSENDEDKLFDVKYTSKNEAEKLLEDGKIEGYIFFDDGVQLSVKKSGLNQSIIKGFLDDYKQTSSTVTNVINENPEALNNNLLNDISERKEFLKEKTVGRDSPNTIVHFFYTLIAMACLYGSFFGLNEVSAVQANQSPQGSRINLAPTHKLKIFTISMLSAVTVHLVTIFILLLFLIFALKIDFGNQLGYIVLTCIAGTFAGVSFGSFVSAIVKKGEGTKVGILVGSSMAMSFLAGMMSTDIKIYVSNKMPIVGYLNPASLITDSFYSLYYYNTHTQYFKNIAILCCITLFFIAVTYFVLRRQKYASV